jgi:hypothetical protein
MGCGTMYVALSIAKKQQELMAIELFQYRIQRDAIVDFLVDRDSVRFTPWLTHRLLALRAPLY